MISKKGDFLEKLNNNIDSEIFREPVKQALREKDPKSPGGRPANDAVVMDKALILRELEKKHGRNHYGYKNHRKRSRS